ncbi:MAG: twin-arginine translocase TatA/TatE family subunit [Dehalococcoidia bacterium]
MPFHIGPIELVIVLVIIMIIFGIGKLPQVGGAMGKAIREFRTSQSGMDEETSQSNTGRANGNRPGSSQNDNN